MACCVSVLVAGADEVCSRVVAKAMTSSAAPPTLGLPSNRNFPRSPTKRRLDSRDLAAVPAVSDRSRLRSS